MNDYSALVGRQTKDLKNLFAPGSDMLAEALGLVTLAGQCGDSNCLLWRIWIPPGTLCFQATMYVYWDELPAKVLMRWGQPPVGGLDSVTPENSAAVDLGNVLALLLTGAEIPCYAPAKAGNIKLSDGRMESKVLTHTGDWLYIKALQMPGNKVYQLDARVTADADEYRAWYASATWDIEGNPLPGVQVYVPTPTPVPTPVDEKEVLKRVKDTGLDVALMELSGAKTDEELAQRALSTGTWAALLKFAANK